MLFHKITTRGSFWIINLPSIAPYLLSPLSLYILTPHFLMSLLECFTQGAWWCLAVSRAMTGRKRAFGSLELWGIPPQLNSLLQVRQDVWHHSLFCCKHYRLHHQQQDPSQSPEPERGSQTGEVLTDFFPVLIDEEKPGEEEEETWGRGEVDLRVTLNLSTVFVK